MLIGIPNYLQRFRDRNAAVDYTGKTVLIIGGTRGLGAAAAEEFASLGASVFIVGRSIKAGKRVLCLCREKRPEGCSSIFRLFTGDLSLLNETNRIADMIENELLLGPQQSADGAYNLGVDVLVLAAWCYGSSSVYSILGGSVKTNEGLDHSFALLYLSRFLFIHRMLPHLLKRPDSRVVNVLNAGSRAVLDLANPNLSGKSNLETISSSGVYLNTLTLSLAEYFPQIAFYHVSVGPMVPYPVVDEDARTQFLSMIMHTLRPWLHPQSPLASEAAESIVYLSIQPEFGAQQSGLLLNNHLENIPLTEFIKQAYTRDCIWNFSVQITKHIAPVSESKCMFLYTSTEMHANGPNISMG